MMLIWVLMRKYLVFLVLTLSLIGWCVAATYQVIWNPPKALIIAIDSNGTRVVSEASDPIFKTEVVSFIRTFLSGVYNFSAINFTQSVGTSTNLMSESYWKANREKILGLKQTVEAADLTYSGKIERITKVDDRHYQALLTVEELSRLRKSTYKMLVDLEVGLTKRTRMNPWGLEVINVEEKKLD